MRKHTCNSRRLNYEQLPLKCRLLTGPYHRGNADSSQQQESLPADVFPQDGVLHITGTLTITTPVSIHNWPCADRPEPLAGQVPRWTARVRASCGLSVDSLHSSANTRCVNNIARPHDSLRSPRPESKRHQCDEPCPATSVCDACRAYGLLKSHDSFATDTVLLCGAPCAPAMFQHVPLRT